MFDEEKRIVINRVPKPITVLGYAGNTIPIQINWITRDPMTHVKTPVDLTGWSAIMDFKRKASDTSALISITSAVISAPSNPPLSAPLITIQSTHNIYYVSPAGSDSNAGTLLSSPLLTIGAAITKAIAGDAIYIMTGVYPEAVVINQNGITLSAYPNSNPVIDGRTTLPSSNWGALIMVNGNNNNIVGIEVKNSNVTGAVSGGYGIQLVGSNNTVSYAKVHDCWNQGIVLSGDYSSALYCTVYSAALQNINGTMSSGWANGISTGGGGALVAGLTSYANIQGCTVYNCWGEGIDTFNSVNCTMQDNTCYDNWATNMYLSNAYNCLVQRNLLYASSSPAIPTHNNNPIGIQLSDELNTPLSHDNKIINNMIYGASLSAFSWSIPSGAGLNNTLIAYNTVINGSLHTGSGSIVNAASTIENNLFVNSAATVPSTTGLTFISNAWSIVQVPNAQSTGDVVGNALASSVGTTTAGALTPQYFELPSNSPVVGNATPIISIAQDYFLNARSSTNPTIGAYEYSASITTGSVSGGIVLGGSPMNIVTALSPAQSATLGAGKFVADLKLTDPRGGVWTKASLQYVLQQMVTI